ncbi:hypothetical protein E3V08_03490 [Candidatus Atribacteria bacterium MT.SAG.1]|nr:hypothetical protein E3V08_03490 [Candidatus Atribacteria bacterium MT.SAG.1]
MKKFIIVLMVLVVASVLLVGCLPTTPDPTPDPTADPTPDPTPTTVAPIITSVGEADDGYVNKVEAANGIVVEGTAPTYSEIKVYINGITAGTGDSEANGEWEVVIAKADLEKAAKGDGDKTLYATAEEPGLAVSASSNVETFKLDTAAPQILSVKARGGQAGVVGTVEITYQTHEDDVDMFTETVFDADELLPGTTLWKVEILTITGITPEVVTVRVYNLSAGTFIDYGFNDHPTLAPITSSKSWIPGAEIMVFDPLVSGAGLNSALHVGAYALIKTVKTGAIPGRVSLTFNEDVTWTQATGGNYTIFNNFAGWDILTGAPLFIAGTGVTDFFAYDETSDTMFWQETLGNEAVDLTQGQLLTFQVDSVADIAGNSIPVDSPETANTTILASTVAIGP